MRLTQTDWKKIWEKFETWYHITILRADIRKQAFWWRDQQKAIERIVNKQLKSKMKG